MKKKPKAKPELYTFKATWEPSKDDVKRFAKAVTNSGKTDYYVSASELEALSLRVSRLELDREAEALQLKRIMNYFQRYFTGRE